MSQSQHDLLIQQLNNILSILITVQYNGLYKKICIRVCIYLYVCTLQYAVDKTDDFFFFFTSLLFSQSAKMHTSLHLSLSSPLPTVVILENQSVHQQLSSPTSSCRVDDLICEPCSERASAEGRGNIIKAVVCWERQHLNTTAIFVTSLKVCNVKP